jgi:tRNA (cytidine/uridine-2'-O-)-methyltransferase
LYSAEIKKDAIFIFGSETAGLPSYAKELWAEDFYTLPMHKEARCLNLANSVSIAIYEGLRQQDFVSLDLFQSSLCSN